MAGAAAGAVAGAITGTLHTKFSINSLLSGILVMTALYSVNLHVMGKSNVPLMQEATLATQRRASGRAPVRHRRRPRRVRMGGRRTRRLDAPRDAGLRRSHSAWRSTLFFRTNLGTAIRATGDNPQMIRALGVSVDYVLILGLALSNGLIALSGSLLAQYQGFADVQMGIGMVVWGLASVIIGEALVGTTSVGYLIAGAIMGSVLFRLLVAIALRWGLNPNDLKLITALFVFAALVTPRLLRALKTRRSSAAPARS